MSRLYTVICEVLELPTEAVQPSMSWENCEAWTSLKHLELMLALEREFGLQLDTEQMLQLNSVASIQQTLQDQGLS